MGDANSAESPLEAASGAAGSAATAAFSALGNETRLAILLALWEAYDPYEADNAVPFSSLRERVGMGDSGQFNYHLDKLDGRFVRKTDDGYELRRAGQKIVRAVIAGAGLEEPTLETTEIDFDCWFCGAPTAVTYDEGWLYHVCTDCEGAFSGGEEGPDGFLGGMALDPAGLSNRAPGEMLIAGWMQAFYHFHIWIEGICDECSGEMTRSLHVCDDHAPEGMCANCGRRVPFVIRFECTVCKSDHQVPPRLAIMYHPAVVAFYFDHDVYRPDGTTGLETLEQLAELIANHEEDLVSVEPPRVQVTSRYEGDAVRLTFDEAATVVDVSTES